MKLLLLLFFALACLSACTPKPKTFAELNPAADGFDITHSDPTAVQLADSIMVAMGGRQNWDETKVISWNFFGARDLTWDKQTGRVRIVSPRDTSVYLVNVFTNQGKVKFHGQEMTEPDTLKKLLAQAKSIWINDSYWLTMPFKLKDSGVTLKDIGTDTLKNNRYRILELTFANVGDTPENKYRVYVDPTDKLIKQWAFYRDAKKDTADFVRPWDNYKRYGAILLSADRSDDGGPKNVKIEQSVPDKIFTDF
jgi:hypothetical protein